MLTKKTKGGLVILEVYVDDIILTGSDDTGILTTKTYLQQHLSISDLGSPRYFLGIEFAHQDGKLALTQRKYALGMLKETGLLGCKPEASLMVRFRASLNHKNLSQTKFIKPNSQR